MPNALLSVLLKLLDILVADGNSLDALDLLSFNEYNDSPDSGNHTPEADKEPGRPAGPVISVHSPHEAGETTLKEGIPDHQPDYGAQLPNWRGRCALTGQGGVGNLILGIWTGDRRDKVR